MGILKKINKKTFQLKKGIKMTENYIEALKEGKELRVECIDELFFLIRDYLNSGITKMVSAVKLRRGSIALIRRDKGRLEIDMLGLFPASSIRTEEQIMQKLEPIKKLTDNFSVKWGEELLCVVTPEYTKCFPRKI